MAGNHSKFMERQDIYRFKGTFNWYGEIHTLYTVAKCKDRAFDNFTSRLGRSLDRTVRCIRFYFDGRKDNWEIERR